ncbi:MAG: D-alanine--D-alanine ligase [bacterium]|nr:D-alanine--D-alanine ligase [bacterium]
MESNYSKIDKETKIGVLCGGMSAEREVSLRSGKNVLKALLNLGYKNSILIDVNPDVAQKLKDEKIEICYNTLHGRYGEDGCIQGLLEIMGIKYTGCNVKSSAICMDKETTKNVLKERGLRIIKSVCVNFGEDFIEAVKKLNYPLMVKPAKEGSSIGMSKVSNDDELKKAMEIAYKSDSKVLIEEYLQGKSCTVGVLEDEDKTFATPVLGFETKTEWYDYEAKYTEGLTKFVLPADLSEDLTEEIQKTAILAHRACECTGVSRVDFLIYNNIPYILEINTNPGMTDLSDLPAQANHMGIDYDSLVQIILNTALIEK